MYRYVIFPLPLSSHHKILQLISVQSIERKHKVNRSLCIRISGYMYTLIAICHWFPTFIAKCRGYIVFTLSIHMAVSLAITLSFLLDNMEKNYQISIIRFCNFFHINKFSLQVIEYLFATVCLRVVALSLTYQCHLFLVNYLKINFWISVYNVKPCLGF